ncbi:lipopolysaccharide biosynthesis protein [uncultured Eubacterium sp.]|uniref:lipopolysaccharide biosynthesis protein n=1 Tax=uncultured Eubacterium sp. TaxID=165185 RepID=UPI0025EC57E4|nr:lipopolysaccharide biosynthesis protein [uncultured Eubacterium sp.]
MTTRQNVLSNLIWRFLERCGAQLVTLFVSIILARLLDPTVYGVVALVTVITTVLQVFVDGGFATALIQKKDADDTDFSTVFYFNLIACIIMYAIVFFVAPIIATFYKMPDLTAVIRVVSLIIVISGVKNVQQAYVSRNMLFKRFFFATLGGTLGAAVVGIALAYLGYGVWALVGQMLFNTSVDTMILWITVKWRPIKAFSIRRLKGLFAFGWKMLVANLIATVNGQLRQLIIGKIYSSEDLAFYNRGRQFPDLIVSNINTSIDSVLFPTLSNEQDNYSRVREMTRQSIKVSTYIMAPLMMGLFACADTIVSLILTDKWLPCVPYLRIFCVSFFFYPIQTANLNAIKATGRSNVLLKLEIIKDVFSVMVLVFTMKFGTLIIAYGMLGCSIFSQVVNSRPNRETLKYTYKQQLLDILPNGLMGIIMGIIVYSIGELHLKNGIILALQIVIGAFVYILLSRLTKNSSFSYVLSIMKSTVVRKRIIK